MSHILFNCLGRLPTWASLVAQMVKNLPAMQDTQVRSLGQEDPLEKEMATHSSIFAWEIPWTEEPGRLQSTGLQRVRHDLATKQQTTSYLSSSFHCHANNCPVVLKRVALMFFS